MKLPRSIQFRLQLWHGLLLFVVLAAFVGLARRWTWEEQLDRTDEQLARHVLSVLESDRPPSERRPSPDLIKQRIGANIAAFEQRARGGNDYLVFLDTDGSLLASTANAPARIPMPAAGRRARPTLIPFQNVTWETRTRDGFREVYRVLPLGDALLAGRPLAEPEAALRRRMIPLAAAALGLLTLGLLGGLWLTRQALRPIEDISHAAARIASGDLTQRINVQASGSELGALARTLNAMFDQLEASFDRQARFTADASHELRTPVAVLLSKIQMTLARERAPQEYRDALEVCGRAANRMRALTESLLTLSRLDAGQDNPDAGREPVALHALATQTAALLEPLAAARGIQILAEGEEVWVEGDANRLTQAITNLCTNAIEHGGAGIAIRVTTREEAAHAILEVADTGPGIPPEHLPRVFDRFYRGDGARAGQHNTGLGLSIVQAIATAHGGAICARNQPTGGAVFTLRLPLRAAPAAEGERQGQAAASGDAQRAGFRRRGDAHFLQGE